MFEQRDEIQEKRLQHQLEVQSMQIEHVFNRHQMDAHVAGGTVKPRSISFNLHTQLATGLERLKVLTDDLMHTLGVPVSLSREDGVFRLDVSQREMPPVSLLDLMSLLVEVPPITAVLGLAEDGRPVLLDFSEQDMTHILVSGVSGAGKTALLRSLAISLALMNRQSRVQFVIVDGACNGAGEGATLQGLNYLPHMLAKVIGDSEDVRETMAFLMNEVSYRLEYEVVAPTILVVVDEVVALLESGEPLVRDGIRFLAQRGADVGVHLVMSTDRPQSAVLDNLLKANISVQIVGRMADGDQAVAITGVQGSQAEYLLGQGDFLAVAGQYMTHFQAAYIGDYDLHMTLQELHRNRPPALLAQAVNDFISLADAELEMADEELPQHFVFNGDVVSLRVEGVEKVSLAMELEEVAEKELGHQPLVYAPQPMIRLFHDEEMAVEDVVEEEVEVEVAEELETADSSFPFIEDEPDDTLSDVKIYHVLGDVSQRRPYHFPMVNEQSTAKPFEVISTVPAKKALFVEAELEEAVAEVAVVDFEETDDGILVADLEEEPETEYEMFEDDWLPFDDD